MGKSPQISFKKIQSSLFNHPIYLIQTPHTRAINVGYIRKSKNSGKFVPGRLNFGSEREKDTYQGTLETLKLPVVSKILHKYKPEKISTITVLRETLSCSIWRALSEIGIKSHYGDAFIGASHIKDKGPIRSAYLYENTEGLVKNGLWVVVESLCTGRNLIATLKSLLPKSRPREILFITPIASRLAINNISEITAKYKVKTTFIAWGALFGVDKKTLYDMPWGHPDTEVLDKRDQDLIVYIYGAKLCMGGDFGNNYYCPVLAMDLYQQQLKKYHITPKIPSVKKILSKYKQDEMNVINK